MGVVMTKILEIDRCDECKHYGRITVKKLEAREIGVIVPYGILTEGCRLENRDCKCNEIPKWCQLGDVED